MTGGVQWKKICTIMTEATITHTASHDKLPKKSDAIDFPTKILHLLNKETKSQKKTKKHQELNEYLQSQKIPYSISENEKEISIKIDNEEYKFEKLNLLGIKTWEMVL
mgnify:CR=1 FL=1